MAVVLLGGPTQVPQPLLFGLYFTSSANPLTISVKLTRRLNFTSLNSANKRLPR